MLVQEVALLRVAPGGCWGHCCRQPGRGQCGPADRIAKDELNRKEEVAVCRGVIQIWKTGGLES